MAAHAKLKKSDVLLRRLPAEVYASRQRCIMCRRRGKVARISSLFSCFKFVVDIISKS